MNLHPVVRLAIIAALLVLPAGALHADAGNAHALPWIDGTHILAQAYQPQIEALAGHKLSASTLAVHPPKAVHLGETENFWAMNMVTRQPYQTTAVLRKVGKHCYIYAEQGYDLSDATAAKLAQQFDDIIYPRDTEWFGSEPNPGIDGDSRITLLLMDIIDGWQPGQGYVAGYFFPLNEVSQRLFQWSNEREMFYLDTHPGDPTRDDYLGVLAHEFQHMIHFNHDPKETRWLNEALSQLAFYVCGYGHAPQIFQYLHNTNMDMEDFQNTLENYGGAYLWIYYLYCHQAGADEAAKKAFIRDLVDNKKQGMESIQDTMAAHGGQGKIRDIFADWATANAACDSSLEDGRYGFDGQLKFGIINEKETFDLAAMASAPSADTKDTVLEWDANYIQYLNDMSYAPHDPTMIDKVTIKSDKPASAVWNVNDSQLPPAKLIPDGSTTNASSHQVTTPLAKQADGSYAIKIGHFARLGVVVDKVNFQLSFPDGTTGPSKTVNIFALPPLAQSSGPEMASTLARRSPVGAATPRDTDSLQFEFSGTSGKSFVVRSVVKADGKTTVADVALDGKNHGTATIDHACCADSITFVVVGQTKGKSEFSYNAKRVSGTPDASSMAERALELSSERDRAEAMLADGSSDAGLAAFAAAAGRAASSLAATLAGRVAAGDAGAQSLSTWANAGAARGDTHAMAIRDILRSGVRTARFDGLHAGIAGRMAGAAAALAPMTPAPVATGPAAAARDDDGDTSHDNLTYILSKNAETVHALGHLMIDPQFLEGQIFQLWKLLELVRGLPHIPLPDGLALKSYDIKADTALIEGWAHDLGIEIHPMGRSVDPAQAGQVKEVAKRLLLANNLVETAYNNGLVLGQDLSMTVYYFAEFIMGARGSVAAIAAHFAHVPVIGALAGQVKKIIIGKLMRAVDDLVWAISSRMKPPYNEILPIAVQVITGAIAHSQGITVDPAAYPGFTKEYAIGLFGKYALTSLPKIGYTARGQKGVDLADQLASALTVNGSFADAYSKVWDDGNASTASSVREKILTQILHRHKVAMTDQQIAWVTGKLAEVARYASLIDPTAISKIAAVALTVATAGLFVHSGYETGSYFFSLPHGDALEGVRRAFDPNGTSAPGTPEAQLLAGAPDGQSITQMESDMETAMAELTAAAQELAQGQSGAAPEAAASAKIAWGRVLAADESLDDLTSQAEAQVLASSAGDARTMSDSDVEAFYAKAQEFNLSRAKLMADLLAHLLDGSQPVRLSSDYAPTFTSYLDAVKAGLNRVALSASVAVPLVVSKGRVTIHGDTALVEARVRNAGSVAVNNVSVQLYSMMSFTGVDGDVHALGTLQPRESRAVSFMIKLNQPAAEGSTLAIVPSAEGAVPMAQTISFE